VLFRKGRELIKAGKLAEGCEKLDASARLESTVGTLLNLGDCREQLGQDATAWAVFAKAAAVAHVASDPKREAEGKRREQLLEKRLSYLTVVVPPASKVPGLAIARNGATLDPALWDQDVPVDPGEYDITGEAPGRERWHAHIKVEAGGARVRVEVPVLSGHGGGTEPLPPRPQPVNPPLVGPPVVGPGAPAGPVGPPVAPPGSQPELAQPGMTTARKTALVVGSAGIVALGVGMYFGLQASNEESQANMLCPAVSCNNAHAVQLNSDARSDGLTATIALAGGGALLAGAVVLWLVGSPSNNETVTVAPVVSPDGVGLAAFGRF
jgi:hypothetical protein